MLCIQDNFLFETQLHEEYNGPKLGPKMATENKRNFGNYCIYE